MAAPSSQPPLSTAVDLHAGNIADHVLAIWTVPNCCCLRPDQHPSHKWQLAAAGHAPTVQSCPCYSCPTQAGVASVYCTEPLPCCNPAKYIHQARGDGSTMGREAGGHCTRRRNLLLCCSRQPSRCHMWPHRPQIPQPLSNPLNHRHGRPECGVLPEIASQAGGARTKTAQLAAVCTQTANQEPRSITMVLAWLAGAALGGSAGVAVRAAAPLPCRTCFCSLWVELEHH
jgi:hypothetical protein